MPVRHYRQSSPGACLPACVRMVCAALGDNRTEAYWADMLGSYNFGTPASRVTHLRRLGYEVEYGPSTLDLLETHLQAGKGVIIFVRADLLPWADFGGFHALVLSRITPDELLLHDPALPTGPTPLPRAEFLLAWDEFDCIAAIISR